MTNSEINVSHGANNLTLPTSLLSPLSPLSTRLLHYRSGLYRHFEPSYLRIKQGSDFADCAKTKYKYLITVARYFFFSNGQDHKKSYRKLKLGLHRATWDNFYSFYHIQFMCKGFSIDDTLGNVLCI
jgi:hypothetical protein